MKDLRIVELRSENVKKIKAVQITPDGNTVLITGGNGEGKSSVIDSILYALNGGNSLPDMPIREGEEEAEINIDLGEIKVQRIWKGDRKVLKVFSKDGAVFSSPQDILNKLVGELSFDPMKFLSVAEKEQREILLELCGVDVETLDADRKAAYIKRTDVGREVTALEGKLKGKEFDPELPIEEKSVKELTDKVLHETQQGSLKETTEERVQNGLNFIEEQIQHIKNLEEDVMAAKDKLNTFKVNVEKLKKDRDIIIVGDIAALETELSTIEETNTKIRENQKTRDLQVDLDIEKKNKTTLDSAIKAIDKEKEDLIASAKMPIKGLSFSEDSITFEGIPLKQVNSADQFKICLAMGMALNPRLKVILFKNGSLLDKKSLKYVSDLADKHDYQIWIEKVDESGEVGIVIEDGQVKE